MEVPVKEIVEKVVEIIVERIVEIPVEKIVERVVEKVCSDFRRMSPRRLRSTLVLSCGRKHRFRLLWL